MKRLVEAIPYAKLLGLEVERTDAGLLFVMPFRDELVGNAGLPAIHGGALGAFLELSALVQLIDQGDGTRLPKPINFSIDFLRSAGPKTTHGRADIFKLGRRIANVHVVAWQEDEAKPVAAGNGKFLLS